MRIPAQKSEGTVSVLTRSASVVAFAVLTAAAARLVIPVPGTPVPITAQTLVVALAGITLGARLGLLSMGLYLLLGLTGYHVFAGTPEALRTLGLAYLVGPTGGYLVGFVLAQAVLGMLTEAPRLPGRRGRVHWTTLLSALLAGHAVIFAAGLAWLAIWAGSDLWQTLRMGLFPFLPGMAVKIVIAMGLGGAALRWLRPRLAGH